MADTQKQLVVASISGRMKIIKCSPSILKEVLALVDGNSSISAIINGLAHKYPVEDVQDFLKTLIDVKVIVNKVKISPDRLITPAFGDDSLCNGRECGKQVSIVLAGEGVICDSFERLFSSKAYLSMHRLRNTDQNAVEGKADGYKMASELIGEECLKDKTNVVLLICPETATHGRLSALNELCLDLRLPCVFCYFNGKHILTGPSMIPGKTPCYGCLLEHRRLFMVRKSGLAIEHKLLHPLIEATSLEKHPYDRAVIDWIASHLASEALRICRADSSLSFVKKQLQVPLQIAARFSETRFEPVTTCLCCSGMNRGKIKVGRPLETDGGERHKIVLKHRPIVYTWGGRRSVSAQEARDVIKEAIRRTGLNIRIEKTGTGPLDEKLFRYGSVLKGGVNERLPFLAAGHMMQRGKGITQEQAYLSAAFEMFERLCAEYYGDIEMVRASYSEVEDMALDLTRYLGTPFYHGLFDHFDRTSPIDWVWGYSLTHERPKLVPASVAFLSKSLFLGHFFDPSSGGLSAGATIEDAILQGLLELIEHDAWMIWQANATITPQIRIETIDLASLMSVIEHIHAQGMKIIVRNYTTDISIPVFRTWIVNENDYRYYATNGFGASPDPGTALERSITEAYQSLKFVSEEEQMVYRGPSAMELASSYYSLFSLYHFNKLEMPNNNNNMFMDYHQVPSRATDSVAGDIGLITTILRESIPNSDVIVVNLTKEALGVPVVRVVVEGGLQRFAKPTIAAHQRLFELPVKMGFSQHRLDFRELFNGPFPH